MSTLSVNTSQNIELNYHLASIGDRILSTIIDNIILAAYALILVGSIITIAENEKIDIFDSFGFILLIMIIFSPVIFYHLVCEVFMQGQSFGKKAMKIKVVKLDGSQPTFGSYLIRWLLRIIDSFPYYGIGLVSTIVTDKTQRLGDLAANTVVIKIKRNISLKDITNIELPEDHIVQYNNVLILKDKEVDLIQSILNRKEDDKKPILIKEVANKIKHVLEITDDETPARPFLDQIIKDFNYLSIK